MNIEKNIISVKERIANICYKIGRDPVSIKLLAVTKTHPIEIIETALNAGIEYIAENRIQDAENKIPDLLKKYKEFHFIGHLQSNKIKKLMKLEPELIHSIDSLSTAGKLNDYLIRINRFQDILIQVNTSEEASKFGIAPIETLPFIKNIDQLSNLRTKGLMTIGMFTDNKDIIRNCFRILRELFEKISKIDFNNTEMKYLSMGMTDDFEIAIEEGANILRIGSAIFGPRNY